MIFYRVIRPYCYPGVCFTFALTNKDAVAKVNKKHGFATRTTAFQVREKEMKSIIIDLHD